MRMRKTIIILEVILLLALIGCFAFVYNSRMSSSADATKLAQVITEPMEEMTDILPAGEKDLPDIGITEDYRESFVHGEKGWMHQKYIVLHDTEGEADAASVINSWDNSGNGVATHFIVNKDGSIWQCVPMDKIAHHMGHGDNGHNDEYGVTDESRDDMVGADDTPDPGVEDYGMNSYSIGIEMVHVGGSGYYPEEQLEALDKLIAYIDAYYGFESKIIDHKAWRTGNSDTSPEFAEYLENYQTKRKHK